MALETDFNVSPYFDDYDEEKNFHRILFKPAVAVQARELTQLQTMLQQQVERFGDYVFKDGSVIKGVSQRTQRIFNVKLRDNQANGSVLPVADLLRANTYLKGNTSGILAEVVKIADGAEVTSPDFKTLFVRYITTGTNKTQKEFSNNEVVFLVTTSNTEQKVVDSFGKSLEANTLATGATGNSLLFTVGDGLVYQKGNFIRVEAQSKVIGKYTLYPTTQVGFDINELLINSNIDDSINDNALGSTNYQAPGADRLKLSAALTQRDENAVGNSQPFFPIAEFKNGLQTSSASRTDINELGNKLAERTYEESGDYILRPFNIRVQEHLNTNTNFGSYNTDASIRGVVGNRNKLVASIQGGGVAYVRGFRNEITNNIPVDIDKGTDVEEINAQPVTFDYGGYVLVDEFCGKWSLKSTSGTTISLYDTAQNAVSSKTYGKTSVSGSSIGTAKLTMVKFETGSEEDGTGTAKYRVYLYDIEMNSGKSFQDTRSLYVASSMGGGEHSFADIILQGGRATLRESNKTKLLFDFGTNAVKTLRDSGGNNDNQYQFRTESDFTFTGGSSATTTVSKATGFDTGNQPESVTGSSDDFIVTFLNDAETELIFTGSLAGNTITRTSGNTSLDSKFSVGELVRTNAPGGANTGIFKVHAVTSTTVVLDGQPSGSNQEVIKYYPAGYVLDFNSKAGTEGTRSISGSGSSITIELKEKLAADSSASVSYKLLKTTAVEKDKIVRRNRFVGINAATASGGTSGPWTLGVSDVFRLKAVYQGSTYSEGGTDVTSSFELVTNQQDTHYENSSIKLKDDATITVGGSDKLTVQFDYFEHDRTDGIGYFSVDSYPVDDTTASASANTIQTAEIPLYRSPSTKVRYDLRDSVDFRPRYKNQTQGSTTVAAIPTINTANTLADHSSFGNYLPVVDTNFQADLQYYLPRIDKLVLSKDGQVYVTKGISSLTPQAPRDQGDGITLAQFNIPPYPSLAPGQSFNRPDYQTRMNLRRYKRFTMKDIGAFEERLTRLEYYSALNLLEQSTRDIRELDGSGVDRFKNGFFADPFVGHQLGDIDDPNYRIAIDAPAGEARPKFATNLVEVEYNRLTSQNVIDRPTDVRLEINLGSASNDLWNYIQTEVNAGRTVQVFQGSNFGTRTAGGLIVNYGTGAKRYAYVEQIDGSSTLEGKFTAGALNVNLSGGASGVIDAIKTTPRGKLLTVPYKHDSFIKQPMASKLRNPTGEISFNWTGHLELIPSVDTWKSEEVAPNVQIDINLASNLETIANAFGTQWGDWTDLPPQVSTSSTSTNNWWFNNTTTTTTTTVNQRQREGTALEVIPGQQQFFQGEFVTDVSVQPFMRSRIIKVHGIGIRPNTKLHAFFDEINVDEYIQPWNDDFAANTGNFGTNVTSSDTGEFYAKFRIPNDESLKFTIGTKVMKFVDVEDLIIGQDTITTSAKGEYTASGLELSKQGLTINTQDGQLVQTNPVERSTPRVTTDVSTVRNWGGFNWPWGLGWSFDDPLAQTFSMPSTAPAAFISKVDLYFKEKDNAYGIDLQIREVENGTITQRLVPFGITTLFPEDVNISSDATRPTSFTFPTPIHLAAGKEYALVIYPHGGSPRYRCWVSKLGGKDVTTNRLIAKQPSVGVLYTSSNDNVYNAFQSEDVKFEIFRALFDTTVIGSARFENSAIDHYAYTNNKGNFITGEQVRGMSRLRLSQIGFDTQNGGTSTNTGISIDTNAQVRGLSSGSVGLVRHIISQTANVAHVLVDSANTFTNGEDIRVTRSANTNDVIFAQANTSGGQQNTVTSDVQTFNNITKRLTTNNMVGTFTANTTSYNGWVRGQQSNAVAQVTHVHDLKVNVITPRFSYVDYGNTNITWYHSIASNNTSTYANSGLLSMTVGGLNYFSTEKSIASKSNHNKTYFVKSELQTSTDFFSPVIDLDKNPSAIAVQNIINDPYATNTIAAAKEATGSSDASAVYISRPITLADGQDAEDFKIFITGYKPAGADLKVFGRFLSADDPEGLEDKNYTLMTQITPANVVSSTTNTNDFREYEYGLTAGANAVGNTTAQSAYLFSGNNNVISYHDNGGAQYHTYKTFNIKVVMTSNNSVDVPRMTDLRAIAMQV